MNVNPPTPEAPIPAPTPQTAPFWAAARASKLVIQHCLGCRAWVFHPRLRCPYCGRDELEWRPAAGRASLWSYVIVHRGEPAFAHRVPYVLGVVRLEEGPHMLGIIEGIEPSPAALTIDMPLVVDFEKRGDQQVPIWRPAEAT